MSEADEEGRAEFERRVRAELIPKLRNSHVAVPILPQTDSDYIDVKFATELGAMILLDKPIIAVVLPGTKVPKKLVQVADAIIEGDMSDPAKRNELVRRIQEHAARLSPKEPDHGQAQGD